MPTYGRSYYPTGASVTEVGGGGVDPTAALQALIGQESSVMASRPQQVAQPVFQPTGGLGGGGYSPSAYRPSVSTPDNRQAQANATFRYQGQTAPNYGAALENMDVVAGDLQKNGAQRITDRGNRMRAMIGIPNGDITQGSYNPGPSPASMVDALTNSRLADARLAEPNSAQKTEMARARAGWYSTPGV